MKKEKVIFKEFIYYVMMFMALYMVTVSVTSCSQDSDEYINEEFSGKTSDKYRIASLPYEEGFGIKILYSSEGVMTIRMLYNNTGSEWDCTEVFVMDERMLSNYVLCPYCEDECEL